MGYMGGSLSRLSSSHRLALVSMVCLLWIAIAIALDHFLIFRYFERLGKCLLLEIKLSVPAGEINLPDISVIVLFGLPLLFLGLALIPWRSIHDRGDWYRAFIRWCQPVFWFFIAIVLAIVGQSIFLLARGHLPTGLVDLSEKFSLELILVSGNFRPATFTWSASALVGLAIGFYLFLQKGVREALN